MTTRLCSWAMRILLVSVLLCASPASSAVIDNGTTTLDTATGLEWLDVSFGRSFTFSEIQAGAGGFAADGWRHATTGEVCALFQSLSGSGFSCPGSVESSPSLVANYGIRLLGETGTAGQSSVRSSRGFFDSGTAGVGVGSIEYHLPDQTSFFGITENLSPRNVAGPHLLVRSVAEPGIAPLVALALAGVRGRRRP